MYLLMGIYSMLTDNFKVGSIVFHKDRCQHYVLLYRTSIKNEVGWWKGWCYVRCYPENGGFYRATGEEMFTRPDALFDADWTFVQ